MKKKVIMIGVVLIVCLGTIFYNMQKRDPYKSYNHLKTSEVLKVKEFIFIQWIIKKAWTLKMG